MAEMDDRSRDRLFAGSIPEVYDQYLVPLIFEGYARDLAARVASTRPTRVLEIAAGTGVVTRAMAEVMPATDIVATDLNQPMLDYAATRTDPGSIHWRQADATALPFDDASFDIVVCQFGVMFFPDRLAAYREARRVLSPGGRFVFNTWDRIEENEIPMTVSDAVASLFPSNPPSFLRRTPHGYHDLERIRAEVGAAGFSVVRAETVARRSRATSPAHAALGFCRGTPLKAEIEQRDPALLGAAVEHAAAAVAARFGPTDVENKIQAHILECVR